jgi:PST family polysaccharide transporter
VRSLTAWTFHGVVWNVLGTVLRQGMTLASGIIVARLLDPQDFAVAGLAAAIAGLFTAISAQGFATALVREQELTPSKCHSIFYFLLAVGLVLWGLMVAIAPLLVEFYQQSALPPVIVVLGAILVVSLAGSVPDALLTRDMRFREKNIISVVGTLLAAGLAIALAFGGYGYWALILPGAGAALALALGAFWVSGYRPGRSFRWGEVRSVGKFGSAMFGSSLLNYLSDNGDYLIMGRFWPKVDFGYYYFAFERSRQPFDLVGGQIGGTLYPAFSRVQEDLDRIRRAYLRGTRLLAFLTFPLYVLLVGLADPVVPWIFGSQWQPAVPAFQVFAVFCFLRTFGLLVSAPLLALNRAHVAFYFNAFRASVSLPALVCLGLCGAGIVTTALVLVVIWFSQAPFYIGYLYRKIHLRWQEFWQSFGRLLLAAVLMGAIVAGVRVAADMWGLPDWAMVLVAVASSCTAFILITRPVLADLADLVRTAMAER